MFRRILDSILRPRTEFPVVVQDDDKADVDAAIAQARETLPLFWRKFEAGEADEFQLKAGLTTPNGATEHIWVRPSGWQDDKVIARLTSDPIDLEDVRAGDEVLIEPERISDWGYFKGGRLYGAFTQRAMLKYSEPKLRRQIEAALSPTPLEAE